MSRHRTKHDPEDQGEVAAAPTPEPEATGNTQGGGLSLQESGMILRQYCQHMRSAMRLSEAVDTALAAEFRLEQAKRDSATLDAQAEERRGVLRDLDGQTLDVRAGLDKLRNDFKRETDEFQSFRAEAARLRLEHEKWQGQAVEEKNKATEAIRAEIERVKGELAAARANLRAFHEQLQGAGQEA